MTGVSLLTSSNEIGKQQLALAKHQGTEHDRLGLPGRHQHDRVALPAGRALDGAVFHVVERQRGAPLSTVDPQPQASPAVGHLDRLEGAAARAGSAPR